MTIKAEIFHQPSLHRKHLMANLERINIHFSGVWRMTEGHFSRISLTPLAFISSSLAAAEGIHTGSMITPPLAAESTMDPWERFALSLNPPVLSPVRLHMSQLNFRDAKTVTKRVNVSSSFRNIFYTLGDENHTFAEFLKSPGRRFLTSEYKRKLFSYFHLRGRE